MKYNTLKTNLLGFIFLATPLWMGAQIDTIPELLLSKPTGLEIPEGDIPSTPKNMNLTGYSNLDHFNDSINREQVIDSTEDRISTLNTIFEENWDTTRVNAYSGYQLEMPFELKFDDLNCVSPIEDTIVVTSRFGRRRRGPHKGIDLDLETGDKVMSILPGKVRFVGYSSGHGRTVVVRHENGVETVYAHLSSYHVKTNELVEKGQVLGKGGTSGNARGSHLHFEIRYKGVCIHPEMIIDFTNEPIIRSNTLWLTQSGINPLYHSSYMASDISVYESKELALEGQRIEPKIHVVQKGDTLWGIARNNGMQVKDIVAMNKNVSSKSTLRIGQHLIISP